MLSRLFIKNYALIDNLDIVFDRGLNMITGETGAGKSILMGALGLILGNRAEGKQFFDEDKKCVIEGYFDIESYDLKAFFEEHDLEYEKETIIRRELSLDGKSRAFVNDSPVSLSSLKSLGEQLVDIHSQHATLQINTQGFQLFVLDSLAKNAEVLTRFQEALKAFRQLEKKWADLLEDVEKANAEMDYNQFLYDELEKLNVQPGEIQILEEEQRQLEHAEEIKRGLGASDYLLVSAEQNILSMLNEVVQHVQQVGRYHIGAEELSKRMGSAYIELKDIADEVGQLESTVYLDENRLDEVNTRLDLIYTLLKKHRLETADELIELKNNLHEKLQIALHQDSVLAALSADLQNRKDEVIQIGKTLHHKREGIMGQVERYVKETLAHVGMPHAQLKVELEGVDFSKVTQQGMDTVQFLFSANKGQQVQPIHKVASGGELSRVMLAIKSLVAQSSALPTIIFDEIDTGISGEVSLRVGEIMDDLARNMQVIAISHLPQIASKGEAHFKVYKEDVAEKTRSHIQRLDSDQRVVEIAQMLSGANPGEAALQHAKELLG